MIEVLNRNFKKDAELHQWDNKNTSESNNINVDDNITNNNSIEKYNDLDDSILEVNT